MIGSVAQAVEYVAAEQVEQGGLVVVVQSSKAAGLDFQNTGQAAAVRVENDGEHVLLTVHSDFGRQPGLATQAGRQCDLGFGTVEVDASLTDRRAPSGSAAEHPPIGPGRLVPAVPRPFSDEAPSWPVRREHCRCGQGPGYQ